MNISENRVVATYSVHEVQLKHNYSVSKQRNINEREGSVVKQHN